MREKKANSIFNLLKMLERGSIVVHENFGYQFRGENIQEKGRI